MDRYTIVIYIVGDLHEMKPNKRKTNFELPSNDVASRFDFVRIDLIQSFENKQKDLQMRISINRDFNLVRLRFALQPSMTTTNSLQLFLKQQKHKFFFFYFGSRFSL